MRHWNLPSITLLGLLLSCTFTVNAQDNQGPIGFANADGGITGGMGGEVVRVTNRTDFAKQVSGNNPKIVIVDGVFEGTGVNRKNDIITIGSNKTIVGAGANAKLNGIGLNVNGSSNIIIRNLTIYCGSPDAIACRNTHNVWVDHCDLGDQYDTEKEDWDGLLDYTIGSTNLTCSWTRFHDHDKTSACGSGTQHFEDNGKLRVTFHHNSFVHCVQRNPRIGYGRGHVFNNYYEDISSYGVGYYTQAKVLSEANYFSANANNPFNQMYSTEADNIMYAECGNKDNYFGKKLNTSAQNQPTGTDFSPSDYYQYDFARNTAAEVSACVKEGAGPKEGLERESILWPGNGMTQVTCNTPLRWSMVENVTSSDLYIGTSLNVMQELKGVQSGYTTSLKPATTYYWYIRNNFSDREPLSTPVYCFTTADEKATYPIPANGDEQVKLREATAEKSACTPLTLRWNPAFDAKSYRVTLSHTGSEDIVKEVTTCSYCPGTLLLGEEYQWHVDVIKTDGTTIEGDTWTFSSNKVEINEGKNEAESLAFSGIVGREYEDGSWIKPASANYCTVGEAGPGALSGVWSGPDALCTLSLTYWNETSGRAWMGIAVNDKQVLSFSGDKSAYAMTTKSTSQEVQLLNGDQIRVDFYTDSKMRCRIDYLNVKVNQLITDIDGIYSLPYAEETEGFNLSGQRVNAHSKGLIIYKGKKIINK